MKRQMTGDSINVQLSSDPDEQRTRLFGDFGTTAMILAGGVCEYVGL